ncbi:hypothetical protein BH09BAC2_BH09BAC2_14930 [soil metagenome]
MGLDNLITFELTVEEVNAFDGALETIRSIIENKVINLTPDERKQYGKIGNRTENWIDKVKGYMDDNANLIPNYLNKAAYDLDFTARKTLQPRLNRLASIIESLDDTQKLISTDLYYNSLAFYHYLKNASEQNVPGSTVIMEDLKEQFPGGGRKRPEPKS